MSLTFFIDQCVPVSVVRALRDDGHVVYVLSDHIPKDSPDEIVIKKAQELDAILVSFDGDFADISMYSPSRYNGIISLQVRNHPEVIPALMRRLAIYASAHPDMSDFKGKLLLVEAHRIRIRV